MVPTFAGALMDLFFMFTIGWMDTTTSGFCKQLVDIVKFRITVSGKTKSSLEDKSSVAKEALVNFSASLHHPCYLHIEYCAYITIVTHMHWCNLEVVLCILQDSV